MTDNEIIKVLEYCTTDGWCSNCPHEKKCIEDEITQLALDLINRQQAEIERLEHLLLGVMHFVDKWLDGAELKQDEVNRARAMREKTLQIVEKLEEENDFLKSIDIDRIKAEAVKEFAERLKEELEGEYIKATNKLENAQNIVVSTNIKIVDNLVKEMVGED